MGYSFNFKRNPVVPQMLELKYKRPYIKHIYIKK